MTKLENKVIKFFEERNLDWMEWIPIAGYGAFIYNSITIIRTHRPVNSVLTRLIYGDPLPLFAHTLYQGAITGLALKLVY